MDWRLIAALSSFGGSLCLVAVVAFPFLNANFGAKPAQPKKPPTTIAFPQQATLSQQPSSAAPAAHKPAPSKPAAASRPSPTEYNPLISPVIEQREAAYTQVSLNVASDPGVQTYQSPAAQIATANANTAIPYVEPETPKLTAPPVAKAPAAGPRVAPPAPQVEQYQGVLTEAQITRIRYSLRLTPEQVLLWPPVHSMLSEMGHQQIAQIKAGQKPTLQAADWPPQKLYGAAGPLLNALRPDQKEQVRSLCRSLGFQMVASMI
jgi:hypothetical protein